MTVETEQETLVTGASSAYEHAPTETIDIAGTRFAYRQLGAATGVPVIFLNHLAAVLENWDPRVIDGIAAKRRVIVFDNRGIGASGGTTPDSVEAMARDAIAFIRALGFDQVDLLGFSLGGMVSQVIAQEEPQLVRKLVLAGTGSEGERLRALATLEPLVSATSTPRAVAAPTSTWPELRPVMARSSRAGRRFSSEAENRVRSRIATRIS